MKRLLLFALVGVALSLCAAFVVMAAQPPRADLVGRFVRYRTLPDGTSAAVFAYPATGTVQTEDKVAFASVEDLKPGDLAGLHYVGKQDTFAPPQWAPDWEIVQRAPR
jgi:hypothetical protein